MPGRRFLTGWDGATDLAVTTYTPFQADAHAAPVRLIVPRVKPTPSSQLPLFATYSYHGFTTDQDGDTLELEADHRRHAEIEYAIRNLKHGVGLHYLPSGRFAANGACLAVHVMAALPGPLDSPHRPSVSRSSPPGPSDDRSLPRPDESPARHAD